MKTAIDTSLLAAASDLFPAIEGARTAIDAAGRLPEDLVALLAEAGVFGMLIPRTLGGLEVDPWEMIEVIERLSWADGAVGWVAAIASGTNGYLSSRLPAAVASAIWADPRTVVCGNIAIPSGIATPVENGFRVSGRWAFGSGSYNSSWLACVCKVKRDDAPPPKDAAHQAVEQPLEERVVVIPTKDCVLLDNWEVVGLRGTGSTDYVVEDVFVPADYSIVRAADPLYGSMYLHRFYLFAHAAHALGIGRRAVETFEDLARVKPMARTDRVLALKPSAQSDIARAQASVAMAKAYLREVVAELWDTVSAGQPLSLKQQGRGRLAIVSCARNAVRAVDLVYEAAGATSIYETSPLARCFRDIHVASQHAVVQTAAYEVAGQTMLDVPPRTPSVL